VAVVDLVVVCWNDRDKIATALDSVFALAEVKYDHGFVRVVVSDNGSTDGSRSYVRERYGDKVTILENGANLGFGAACNRAFAATGSPYIFLLNPDAELREGALASIIAFMREHPRARASTISTEASKNRAASSTRGRAPSYARARGVSGRSSSPTRTDTSCERGRTRRSVASISRSVLRSASGAA
jgi:GT2 family glycosyltransferase